jgi:hypothetical protein
MLSGGVKGLPLDAVSLLASRVEFRMLSELQTMLADGDRMPALVILDEAHHAAAPSYDPLFELRIPVPALFLTATPNRTDGRPIRIDEIAFSITYKELAARGVILMPEIEGFPIRDFDWTEDRVTDLADHIIDRAAAECKKILVLAPRIDRVEEFYRALVSRLAEEDNHPLEVGDIGFVHGQRNSLQCSADDFLAAFARKPRAILISARLLLEGFDDPGIDTVVITYPSTSVIVLMQAAGRCVRYAPGKVSSYVIQARHDDPLAYHIDEGWLYQEISDFLRPQLYDREYSSAEELAAAVRETLAAHRVRQVVVGRIMERLGEVAPGGTCRLLLTGLPYYGPPEAFEARSEWGAVLETPLNSAAFRHLFNTFSNVGASQADPTGFLRHHGALHGVHPDFQDGSDWRAYTDMLTAMYFAGEEVYRDGASSPNGQSRPFRKHRATTWLKSVTFRYRPSVPPSLAAFLADCFNRDQVIALYLQARERFAVAVKVPLPLGGGEALLLERLQADALHGVIEAARAALQAAGAPEQLGAYARFLAGLDGLPLPRRLVDRLDRYLHAESTLVFPLNDTTDTR